jgi:hypothetical protein
MKSGSQNPSGKTLNIANNIWRFFTRQARKTRPGIVILIAVILLILFDIRFRKLESHPYLALRNEYRSQVVLPYYLRSMHRVNPTVVFLGASVLQGVTNTWPHETASALIEQTLDERGKKIYCLNTATMGNNMGDQLAITRASLWNGADAVVLSIHYKLFADHPLVGNPLRFRDSAFYLRNERPLRPLLYGAFKMRRSEWRNVLIRGHLKNFWRLYRYRALITLKSTGSTDNIAQQFEDWYESKLGVVFESGQTGRNILRRLNPDDRDGEYFWKNMLDFAHESEREVYGQVHVGDDNIHLQLLEQWAEMVRESGRSALVYFTPFNRELIDQQGYFDWDDHWAFCVRVQRMMSERGITVLDLTDAVPSAKFTDADHMTRSGHRLLADALLPHVVDMVDEAEGL